MHKPQIQYSGIGQHTKINSKSWSAGVCVAWEASWDVYNNNSISTEVEIV